MSDRPTTVWRVSIGAEILCETTWPVIAQAAWGRASRHRNYAQHGGLAVLQKDGKVIASVQPRTREGHPWPDNSTPQPDWHDVVKQLVLLLKDDGWDAKEIAEAMTDLGLPTSRARIDALRGSTPGRRAAVQPAELVVLLQAVLAKYRQSNEA